MRDWLSCPRCGSALRDEGEALACPCGRYPVVSGIPILASWALDRRFTLEEVLARHQPSPRGLVGKVIRRIAPGTSRIARAIARPEATFLELASALGRTSDLDYFRYRFSDLSHLSSAALLAAIPRGPVLDVGCGAGHLAHALSRRIPESQTAGIDFNFGLLYLARRFMVPGASWICADASTRLPFRDGAFEAAVCADTFNYLPDRKRAAEELLRVVRGPILMSRLADPSFQGRGTQAPLEPQAYLDLFSARTPRLYLDQEILETFLRTRSLDLSRPAQSVEAVMTLAAGVEPRVHPGADFFVSGSRINPIYEAREEGDRLHLRRRFISERYSAIYGKYAEFLPETITVTKAQVAARDPELVRRFVLLDLPALYG